MPQTLISVSELPKAPAVYAMYGGQGSRTYPAYVGIADNLKSRITQHLVRRDSSVVTGASAVSLNPDMITEIRWWEDARFTDRSFLEGAELIAFKALEPVLRSRGAITERAHALTSDAAFCIEMKAMFAGEPTGRLLIQSLQSALSRLSELERRVTEIEEILKNK